MTVGALMENKGERTIYHCGYKCDCAGGHCHVCWSHYFDHKKRQCWMADQSKRQSD